MFHGSMVALITPMSRNDIDTKALCDLVEFHVEAGTHALVAAGTTGESGTLTHEEKLLVIKTVVEQAKERIPVVAGTAANSTRDCIELTQAAMDCGADAALIMTPAYIKPTQEGLYQHYTQIAQNVAMPIILYNVPSRTACDLLPETVARLAHQSNIIGIKEATGQISRLQALLKETDGRMDIYSGDDPTAAEWMLAGARGVISVTANIAAKHMAKLAEMALEGDKVSCDKIDEQLRPLHQLLFVESNPIPVKWAASQMGLVKEDIRLPLTPLSEKHHQALRKVLQALQLL